MSQADEIIELFKREPFHPEPLVHQQILKTSIEDILHSIKSEIEYSRNIEVDEIRAELNDLLIDYSALETEVEELRSRVDAA